MEAKLQRRIQRYGWDKAVPAYEAGWKASLARAHEEVLRQSDAKPGERVLDVACGTGLVALPLAEAVGPSGRVVATDISEEMISKIQRTAMQSDLDNVDAIRADAEDLRSVPDDSVDLATCALGLMYVPEPEKALAEIWRVLKPGGRVVTAVWGERARCGWAEIFPIVDARVQSSVCPLFFRLGTGSLLSIATSAAGFANVESTRLETELPYDRRRCGDRGGLRRRPRRSGLSSVRRADP